jgi:5-formyltetrahydrofolate cyclo-ligase
VPHLVRVAISEIDLLLVPGLAFTERGARLGRGGGYYDSLIASLDPHTTTVGVAFSEQLANEVPLQPHDQFVSLVLTDRGWSVT